MVQVPDVELRKRLEAALLYAISPDTDADRLVAWAGACARGGADLIQLRQKEMSRREIFEVATRMLVEVRAAGALLIVNDHLDIALASGADGVHLGPEDLSVAAARRVAGPTFLIGASASTPAAAQAAEAAGADYIGAGPAFATPVKPAKRVIGPQGVADLQAQVGIPVFAIGGIRLENVPELVVAGVRRVCVIRGLAGAEADDVRRLRSALET